MFLLPNSPSFKEQNAHVASVQNILESHASYLMSRKELSKLVAFVKGTQFDLMVRQAFYRTMLLKGSIDMVFLYVIQLQFLFAGISTT